MPVCIYFVSLNSIIVFTENGVVEYSEEDEGEGEGGETVDAGS